MAKETKKQARRLRRLEQRLTETRELEARRRRKVEQAQLGRAPAKVLQRRARRLQQAVERGAALERRISSLRPGTMVEAPSVIVAEETPPAVAGSVAAGIGQAASAGLVVKAYCLRDRATVVILAPVAVTMRNGRPALAGACPICGSRVVRPG